MRRLGLLALVLVVAHLPRAEAEAIDTAARQRVAAVCEQRLAPGDRDLLPAMAERSSELHAAFCRFELTDSAELQQRIVALLIDAEDAFTSLPALRSFDYAGLIESVESAVSRARGVPNLNRRGLGPPGILVGDAEFGVESVAECDAQVARISADADCRQYFDAFIAIFNHAQNTLAGPLAGATAARLDRLGRRWDEFFETARSQTAWEMALNGALFQRGNEQHQFLPPPDMQWILLHPSVALEHVPDAPDGNETEEALMIEIIGANWWRQDRWYLPSGGSLVTIGSDRAGTDDWALGAALHFRNDFTIGYSERDGEGGVFLSLDLWKAFQRKRAMIEQYRGSLEAVD